MLFDTNSTDVGAGSSNSTNPAFVYATSFSQATFLTSLTTNAVVAGVQFIGWILLRRLIRAVYEPRTYIPPRDEQAPPLGRNLLRPIWQIAMSDSKDILRKNGVDPYVFVRFIRMLAIATVPIWLISWVVLLCVDAVNVSQKHVEGNPKQGLDRFQFGNVSPDQQQRYWAHLVLVWVFDLWFMFVMWREMAHWLEVRQAYLVNPRHSHLAQASTVLITGIPKHLMDERALAELFVHLPGGIKRIWLTRDLKDMPKLWERRNKACKTLEVAQLKLVKAALKKRQKDLAKKGKPVTDLVSAHPDPLKLLDELVPKSKHPMVRLKPSWAPFSLGWLGIGEKVDAVEWARREIADTTAQLAEERARLGGDIRSPGAESDTYQPLASAFIQFNQQIAAHMARQCLAYSVPYKMNRRFIEQSPSNVIWSNMALSDYDVTLRRVLSLLGFIGIIIGWSPISAFIGAMSNITTLTTQYTWLAWLNGTSFGKRLLQGVATGIIPPLLSMLSNLLFPILFRRMSHLEGTVSKTEVEVQVMDRFFTFLIIHSFLLITLASGLIASIKPILDNPTMVASQLATNLPKSSTFFISRLLLQFAGRMTTLMQPISLIIYYIRVIGGSGTPRSIFSSRYSMPTVDYGTEFPLITVYACILLAYMVIAPIINGFGAAFALLSYVVFKYLFIWVIDQPVQSDTGGEFFPKAITHMFVGLYIQQVCLCALFFLARNEKNQVSSLPQGILMAILILITVIVNWVIKSAYSPLQVALPLSMAHLSYGTRQGDAPSPVKTGIGMHWDENLRRWEPGVQSPGSERKVELGADPSHLSLDQSGLSREPSRKSIDQFRKSIGDFSRKSIGHYSRKSMDDQSRKSIDQPRKSMEGTAAEKDHASVEKELASAQKELVSAQEEPSSVDKEEHASVDEVVESLESTAQSPQASPPGSPLPSSTTHQTQNSLSPQALEKLRLTDAAHPPAGDAIEMADFAISRGGRPVPPTQRRRSMTLKTQISEGADDHEEDPESTYFAVPGGPGVRMTKVDDANDPAAFFHPATKDPQPTVWIPVDELGIGPSFVRGNRRASVRSSTRNATISRHGKVTISGPPPDSLGEKGNKKKNWDMTINT